MFRHGEDNRSEDGEGVPKPVNLSCKHVPTCFSQQLRSTTPSFTFNHTLDA